MRRIALLLTTILLLVLPSSSISALQGDVENETTLVPDPIQHPQGA